MTDRRRTRVRAAIGAVALAATAGLGVALAAPAAAESISSFDTAVTIDPDTSMRIVETITYDFEGEYRHGIFRDIPVADETLTGERRTYGVTVTSVTMDGAPVPYVLTDADPFLNVRIGDPNQTITGAHTYIVDYTVTDGLRVLTQEDVDDPEMPDGPAVGDVELFWDFVGTGWEVPVGSARASVTGPGPVLSVRCYFGPAGSRDACPAASTAGVALLGPVTLGSGEALTGAVTYPRSAFSRTPTENVTQGLPSSPVPGIALALLPAALLAAVPSIVAASRRRTDKGAALPLAPPQYSPPDGLTAAEVYAGWRGRRGTTNARVLVAMLLDLTARRWLNSGLDDGHLTVTWTGAGRPPIHAWEEEVLAAALKGQPSATLKGYDADLSKQWSETFRGLVDAAETNGRRNPRGDDPDRRWNWLMLLAVLTLAAGIILAFVGEPFLSGASFTIAVGAFVGFVIARIITPRQETPQSARFMAEVEGFRKVLGTDAAASRREFAQRLGLPPEAIFATMLPYAVVFDLEKSWIAAFPDLTAPQLQAAGYSVLSMSSMDNLVSSSTTSASSAMTAPSSGSGGGGSSGGGGGGGGGGSW